MPRLSETSWLYALFTGLGAALAGGVAALKAWREARKVEIGAEADADATSTERRARALQAEEAADRLGRELRFRDARIEALEAQLAAMSQRLQAIERGMPAGLALAHILAGSPEYQFVADQCQDGLVLSSSGNGGELLQVNRAICEWVGVPPERLLGRAWRSLIHPDDLARAREAEARAWHHTLTGDVLLYRVQSGEHGGKWVALRWFSTGYSQGGRAWSVVRFEGYSTDSAGADLASIQEGAAHG